MEIQFERIEGKAPTYHLTLAVLAAFGIVGLLATWWVFQLPNSFTAGL